ncbi:hypothetical protein JTB14_036364 [Gonioctena quinquepunctata]|nr:hypothetical protein JTB14_036364 [Gonioctena quinquepunctata]
MCFLISKVENEKRITLAAVGFGLCSTENSSKQAKPRIICMYRNQESNLPSASGGSSAEELQLENDDVKTSLAHLFKSLGGRYAKDHLYRCLGQLFTNELAMQCSWFGQRGNYKAKDLYSIKILTESINNSNHPDVSYSYIDKHAGEWFRLSRQRLNREIKKKKCRKLMKNDY